MFCGGRRLGNRVISIAVISLGIGIMLGTLFTWSGFMLLISFALIIFGIWLMCEC